MAIRIVTLPVKVGTRLPLASSAETCTWKGCPVPTLAGGCAVSNTVPVVGCPACSGAEEIAAAVLDQAADWVGPVGAVEGGEGGDGAAALLHLEHRAVT